VAVAGFVVPARPVQAAPLAFTGTLTLQFVPLPEATVVVGGSGIAQVTGGPHLSSLLLPGGTFGPVTTQVDLMIATGTDLFLTGVENQSGGFGATGGSMGLSGIAKLCLLIFDPTCNNAFVPLPIAPTGTPVAGFGIGGTQLATGAVSVTVQHSPWGTAAPTLTSHWSNTTVMTPAIPSGFVHGPASATASSAAQPGGTVQYVTASKVYTSLTAAYPEIPMYAVLNLHFVPESGTPALLVVAAIAVLAAGRRRR
jgi:hypothetical protein